MSTALAGGWTDFNFTISPDAKAIFDKATHGLLGVHYTPLAVATQVVAGTNYSFLSKARGAYPDAHDYAAEVFVFKPLQGDPHIWKIVHLQPQT